MHNTPPLSLPPTDIVNQSPFFGDLLSRKDLAASLTLYLDRLKAGAVLAIDAEWGEGKTWFGQNWAVQLKNDGHKVVFIDAFEQDYIEDPFLLIAAEIAEILKDNPKADSFVKKASGVMNILLPFATKTLINTIGEMTLGKADLSDKINKGVEAIINKGADIASTSIENRIKNHTVEKNTISSFKSELKLLANDEEKPIVIFIDELDRCNPIFAVRLIERLKHLFEVPNVVFILLMNKNQLENAIKGVYGQDTDASAYLGKFINLSLKLPKKGLKIPENGHYRKYVNHVFNRFKFNANAPEYKEFIESFTSYTSIFDMSLRDIERGVALYSFAYPTSSDTSWILAYAITIKIINPPLYAKLLKDDEFSHKEAITFLSNYSQDEWDIKRILKIHSAYASSFTDIDDEIKAYCVPTRGTYTFFSDIAKSIDLSFEF